MAEHPYWPLFLAMVLLSVVAHSAFAQQFEAGSQDLSIGDSEYDTSPSVADDLERDLSAGDGGYDTPEVNDSFIPPASPSPLMQGTRGTGESEVSQSFLLSILNNPRLRISLVLALVGAALLCYLNAFVVIEA